MRDDRHGQILENLDGMKSGSHRFSKHILLRSEAASRSVSKASVEFRPQFRRRHFAIPSQEYNRTAAALDSIELRSDIQFRDKYRSKK